MTVHKSTQIMDPRLWQVLQIVVDRDELPPPTAFRVASTCRELNALLRPSCDVSTKRRRKAVNDFNSPVGYAPRGMLCIRMSSFLPDSTMAPIGCAGSHDMYNIYVQCVGVRDAETMRRGCAYIALICPSPNWIEFRGADDDLITNDMLLLCGRRARGISIASTIITDSCIMHLAHCRSLSMYMCYGVTRASLELMMPSLVCVTDYYCKKNQTKSPTIAWLKQMKQQGMLRVY